MSRRRVLSAAGRAELQRLASLHGGRLTTKSVERVARNKNSPLHEYFEWDDGAAAYRWRLFQARELISSVRVVVTVDNVRIDTVAYVRDPAMAGDEQGHIAVATLGRSREAARKELQYEWDRAVAQIERTRRLAVVLGLVDEFEAMLASLSRFSALVERAS
jgi:hypothetical protein